MTSKQRVLAALNHKTPDRVPFSWGFGINEPVRIKMQSKLDYKTMDELNEYLESFTDIRNVSPDYIGPDDRAMDSYDTEGVDIWGVTRKKVSYGEGAYYEISEYPMADVKTIEDLDNYLWPDIDWFDFSTIKEKINKINSDNEYAIKVGIGNIFESSWYMRGFEQFFMDLLLEPELAQEILKRVTDYFIAYYTKLLDAADGMVDIVFTADDIGHQQGLLLSLDMWETMLKPHHVRLNNVLKKYDVKILYHTDGAVMEAVPGLMDMGIDILEALQFDAGDMDPDVLKNKYGHKLCYHGGISVQKTLPFGTPEEVKAEVRERIRVLGKNGGYILAPSHAIQAGTPVENVLAFIEVVEEQA